ncbi:BglG family transcription antiterminator [Halobacillus salinarum]|uniref:BglG family transcription antiterminator n=1 Tax=Halobacillus salinarum TaxID=2932257 RepID=A0ABY4EU49_9BACI|nr:BglG family transcription antiterminator [Halobacillus salinarum]UOQ45656.1 BglG family transcription antiterminator [Halobacillus salinarum]
MTTILRELMAVEHPLTSTHLASKNGVTSRTTRNDIKQLEEEISAYGAVIKPIRGKGYRLVVHNAQLFRKYLKDAFQENKEAGESLPIYPEDRVRYLISRLLLAEGYMKLDELAEEMHVSKSTIQNDLKAVRQLLDKYGITIDIKPNYGMKLQGTEMRLRFCMAEFILDRNGEKPLNQDLTMHLSALTSEDLSDIWKIMIDEIKEHEITPSDIAINNLYIHIAIAYKRIQSGHHVSLYKASIEEITNKKEYEVADRIVSKVESRLGTTFPEEEVAYIAIHLLGTKMVTDNHLTENRIGEVLGSEIYDVTLEILDRIENKYQLGIRHDHELIIGLGLHLKPAVNRYRYGMNIRNPMLDDIKANYPLMFEAAITAGAVLEEELGIKVDENEIGYMALHIGAAIERIKMNQAPKRCMIVCASGVGSAQLLKYKLQSAFPAKLEVAGTTEYYKLPQMSLEGIDFIVSSIPISEPLPVPVVQVNTIPADKDLRNIEHVLMEHASSLRRFINKELVFLQKSFKRKHDVLAFMDEALQSKKLVGKEFLSSVKEREEAAPTEFGNLVAIPHPITPQTDTTFLTFCTLEKPIQWKNQKVQFICLLCVKKNSTEDLQSMYKALTKIIDNAHLVGNLLKCKTYEEFQAILANE